MSFFTPFAYRQVAGSALPPLTVEFLVIAGGGGAGGSHAGGGGGAGGYRSALTGESTGGTGSLESSLTLSVGTLYGIQVGGGGTGGTETVNPTEGNISAFFSVTSSGGGRGAGLDSTGTATSGGSGGAGCGGTPDAVKLGGAGTASQGFRGGLGSATGSNYGSGGGGGGAAQSGSTSPATATGGDGGIGITTTVSGSLSLAGGGGGSMWTGGAGTKAGGTGSFGGGNSQIPSQPSGSNGSLNTGGGGGGGGNNSFPNRRGGSGGSGIVFLRYPAAYNISVGAGLTATTFTTGSLKVTKFTAGLDNISFS